MPVKLGGRHIDLLTSFRHWVRFKTLLKHSQNKLKWLSTPADRPKTSPENITGAFGLKMRIR